MLNARSVKTTHGMGVGGWVGGGMDILTMPARGHPAKIHKAAVRHNFINYDLGSVWEGRIIRALGQGPRNTARPFRNMIIPHPPAP